VLTGHGRSCALVYLGHVVGYGRISRAPPSALGRILRALPAGDIVDSKINTSIIIDPLSNAHTEYPNPYALCMDHNTDYASLTEGETLAPSGA